jgi:hypothetical protein
MGKFVDACLLGILREEWKEPRILKGFVKNRDKTLPPTQTPNQLFFGLAEKLCLSLK